ncbi:MAG TPA: prephenate dehydratase domain-containing protein [Gaiellaceae bacterium]
MTSVSYPGPVGSHSSAAAEKLAPEAVHRAAASFDAVVDAVVAGEVELGVLPIESSLAGPVAETHDLLYERPVSIVAETRLAVRHCLLARNGTALDAVRVVRSHPQAFDQCRRLLAALPQARRVPAATTADAAREVAESGEPGEVAIASAHAARLYGLHVLDDDVADHPEAFTRFVALAPWTLVARDARPWRTAIAFLTDHAPGALYRALAPFAHHGVNLVQLVSRPLPRSRWNYRFDAVLDGHPYDDNVRLALQELRGRSRKLLVTGCYPAEEEND